MKTEDQITKDKEAVAKMAGAKEGMLAAIRRIDTLEAALKAASADFGSLGKLFEANGMHMQAFVNGNWKMTSVKEVILESIAKITKVL